MNKAEVLSALENSRTQLQQAIEGLTPEEMTQPGTLGEWSIKDILAHISRWEAELIQILYQIQQGSAPKIPDYSTADFQRLNAQFVLESQSRSLQQIKDDLLAVRKQTLKRIEQIPEKDLSDPRRFPSLGGSSLAQVIEAYTFEHDSEHAEQILSWRKQSIR
jgi:hypothetical protein